MNILYFILTAILASITTLIAPSIVLRIRRLKTHKQRKLTAQIRAEVERQLKLIINEN